MLGFEFNADCQWQDVCRFFPEYEVQTDHRLSITLPALSWKNNFHPSEKSESIECSFYVIAADISSPDEVEIQICSTFTLEILPNSDSPETVWTTDLLPSDQLIFVIGVCISQFEQRDRNNKDSATAACYLWAL